MVLVSFCKYEIYFRTFEKYVKHACIVHHVTRVTAVKVIIMSRYNLCDRFPVVAL